MAAAAKADAGPFIGKAFKSCNRLVHVPNRSADVGMSCLPRPFSQQVIIGLFIAINHVRDYCKIKIWVSVQIGDPCVIT